MYMRASSKQTKNLIEPFSPVAENPCAFSQSLAPFSLASREKRSREKERERRTRASGDEKKN